MGKRAVDHPPDFSQLIFHFRDYRFNPEEASPVTQQSSLRVPVPCSWLWAGRMYLLSLSGRNKISHTQLRTPCYFIFFFKVYDNPKHKYIFNQWLSCFLLYFLQQIFVEY